VKIPSKQLKKSLKEEFRNYCNTDNFLAPPFEHETISDWWLDKFTIQTKKLLETKLERLEKFDKKFPDEMFNCLIKNCGVSKCGKVAVKSFISKLLSSQRAEVRAEVLREIKDRLPRKEKMTDRMTGEEVAERYGHNHLLSEINSLLRRMGGEE